MGIIVLLIVGGLFLYFSPRIFRYFQEDLFNRILTIIALFFNFYLALFAASIIRELYVVPEDVDSILSRGDQLDNAYIWMSFSLVILFCYMVYRFYQKNLLRRIVYITSVQIVIISLIRFYNYIKLNGGEQDNLLLTSAGLILGIIAIILNQITDETGIKEYLHIFFKNPFT